MFSIYSRNEVMRTYPERISKNKETRKNFYNFQLSRIFLHYLKSLHPFSALLPLKNWQLEHFIRGLPAGEEKTYSYKEFPYAYAGIEKPYCCFASEWRKKALCFSSAAYRVSQPKSSSDGIIFRSGKTKPLSEVSTSFSALQELGDAKS